jgi:cation diffusion facilitator family transporter
MPADLPAADTPGSYQRASRAARAGVAANLLLSAVKFAGGIYGQSTALIADAFESLTDVFTSTGLAWSLRRAAKPADHDHPYGHGKMENIASTLIAGVLLIVAVAITIGAWDRVRHPEQLKGPTGIALIVSLAAIAVKEALFQYKMRVGRTLGSDSLVAEAWHHRSDAFSSMATTLGIGGAIVGGEHWRILDPIAAFAVSATIAWMALSIFRRSTLDLMDTQVPAALLDHIRETARVVPGVLEVEKVHARKSGIKVLVDIHVEVDDHMTVLDSHRLAHEVEERILGGVSQVEQVLVHIEPHQAAAERGRRPLQAR